MEIAIGVLVFFIVLLLLGVWNLCGKVTVARTDVTRREAVVSGASHRINALEEAILHHKHARGPDRGHASDQKLYDAAFPRLRDQGGGGVLTAAHLKAARAAVKKVTGYEPSPEGPARERYPLQQLLQAKAESDRKNYRAKHFLLRDLINADPAAFLVDSVEGPVAGVTHLGTGFKIHMPLREMPPALRPKVSHDPAPVPASP